MANVVQEVKQSCQILERPFKSFLFSYSLYRLNLTTGCFSLWISEIQVSTFWKSSWLPTKGGPSLYKRTSHSPTLAGCPRSFSLCLCCCCCWLICPSSLLPHWHLSMCNLDTKVAFTYLLKDPRSQNQLAAPFLFDKAETGLWAIKQPGSTPAHITLSRHQN